jgi:hypothetical protein
MTDLAAWIAENTIVCERYRLRLAPQACIACQLSDPERCAGCERTKEQPQLTPRQAQHRRGALNAVKTRRRNAMAKEKETTVGAQQAAPLDRATEAEQGAACCAPTPKARRVQVDGYQPQWNKPTTPPKNSGEWRSGLRQTLRELAGEAVLMGDDPRVVRLVKCCYYLAGELEVRNPGAYPEISDNAGKMLGRD